MYNIQSCISIHINTIFQKHKTYQQKTLQTKPVPASLSKLFLDPTL